MHCHRCRTPGAKSPGTKASLAKAPSPKVPAAKAPRRAGKAAKRPPPAAAGTRIGDREKRYKGVRGVRGVRCRALYLTPFYIKPLLVHPTHLLLHPIPGERHLPRVSHQRCTSTFSSARSTTRPRACALGTASAASVRPTNRCESGARAPLTLCQAEAPCLGEHGGPCGRHTLASARAKVCAVSTSAAFAVPTTTLCSSSAYTAPKWGPAAHCTSGADRKQF